jgi:hypothetical protein
MVLSGLTPMEMAMATTNTVLKAIGSLMTLTDGLIQIETVSLMKMTIS